MKQFIASISYEFIKYLCWSLSQQVYETAACRSSTVFNNPDKEAKSIHLGKCRTTIYEELKQKQKQKILVIWECWYPLGISFYSLKIPASEFSI